MCRKHEAGFPMQGLGKKILPVAIADGGDFFRPAREALAGGKKAFKAARKRTPISRLHTHNCNGNTVLMQEPKDGTFEKRRNGASYFVETIKPRRINDITA